MSDLSQEQYAEAVVVMERTIAALQAELASLKSWERSMRDALVAQEQAELAHSNCEDCGGEGDWATCGPCSEWFGKAIDMRNAILQSQPQPLGWEQS